MKERICNVLSWLAFAYALIVYGLFIDYLINRAGGVGYAFERMDFDEWFVLASPAIVPTLLYIWTGNPRILPWKQTDYDE